MANNIILTNEMLKLLDELYKAEGKTSLLETSNNLVRTSPDSKSFEIANIAMTGLGDYSRNSGFAKGDVTLTWEKFTFENERSKEFNVDDMDDRESMRLTSANLMGEFLRLHVIPEVDAYRFAKYSTKAGKKITGTLTVDTIEDAINDVLTEQKEAEVPVDGSKLYITPTNANLLRKAVKRSVSNGDMVINNGIETYNGLQVIEVPQSRFYTEITLNDGTTASGFAKATEGKDINFMIINSRSVIQLTKHAKMREFQPDTNQDMDAWKFQYRLYHDCFVPKNKTLGICVHSKA